MKMTIFAVLLCVGAFYGQITGSAGDNDPPPDWYYFGIYGINNWSYVSPICNTSTHWHQSPINIVKDATQYDSGLTPLSLVVNTRTGANLTMVNNGHTVNIDYGTNIIHAKGGRLNTTYRVGGVHFHWGSNDSIGSEHRIDGKQFPIELHIVTYDDSRYNGVLNASYTNSTDAIAVFAVFFTVSNTDNPAIQQIVSHFNEVKITGNSTKIPYFDLSSLLPSNTANYYRYMGSLTTPPCAESVIWSLFDTPNTISEKQLQLFRSLVEEIEPDNTTDYLSNNWRPLQDLHGRIVQSSFQASTSNSPSPSSASHSFVTPAFSSVLLLFAVLFMMLA